MGLLSIIVLLVVCLAAWSGWRAGGLGTALGVVGALAGLLVGLVIAGWVARSQLSFATRVIGELVAIVLGMAVTATILQRLTRGVRPRTDRPGLADRLLGVVVRGLGAVVVLSLVLQALLLWSVPGTRPVRSQPAAATALEHLSWLPQLHLTALTDTARAVLPGDLDGIVPSTEQPSDTPVYISDAVSDATVQVIATEPGSSTLSDGSGFVVSGRRVVTANHVVDDGGTVTVRAGGRTYDATVSLVDSRNDLAILSVPDLSVSPLTVAAGRAEPGSAATVVGFPYGGPQHARSATVVGGVAIPVVATSAGPVLRPGYRLATEVRPGNSGGPLLDSQGRVIGVIDSRSLVDPDVGFAITAEPVRTDLLRTGTAQQ